MFTDHDRQEGHEGDRHGEPIPKERRNRAPQVVVTGGRQQQGQTGENQEIGRAQGEETACGNAPAQAEEAGGSDQVEGRVREGIDTVRNTPVGTLIREGMAGG